MLNTIRISKFTSACTKCSSGRKLKSLYYGKRSLSVHESDSTTESSSDSKLGGFARAFVKQMNIDKSQESSDVSFAKMLRNSKFIAMGDPEGRIVTGTIFQVINDDLYIDFGGKFHCVCFRPTKNGNAYVKGAKVRLRIKELELSTKFLGSDKDLTILEADATLLGLKYSSARTV